MILYLEKISRCSSKEDYIGSLSQLLNIQTGSISFWIKYYKVSQLDQSYTIVTAGWNGVDNIAFISVTLLWLPGLCSESE